ncbi:MAG: recombinase family protein [Oscillospiraceae bacterium]|nr:recombinase family protein [Oscillospiraceae bacterium]
MEGLAEYYSAELSQKIRRGIRESALKARSTGGGMALGYKTDQDKAFVIDEPAARAVRIAFDMFIDGKPNADICGYLNSLGFRTSRGNLFGKNSIPKLIQNEKYIGVYKCGDIRLENAMPALITRETFELARAELGRRRVSKQAALSKVKYLLSGIAVCGCCGKNLVGVSGTGKSGEKYYYYYCPTARTKKGCAKKQVPRDWLEDLVVDATLRNVLQPGAIRYIAQKCYELQIEDDSYENEAAFYRKRLADNRKALANLLKALESGLDSSSVTARVKELEQENLSLGKELKRLDAEHIVLTPERIEFMLLRYAAPERDDAARKAEILNTFVMQARLYDDKLVVLYHINDAQPRFRQNEIAIPEADVFDHDENWWSIGDSNP